MFQVRRLLFATYVCRQFIIVGGQMAYVAQMDDELVAEYGRPDRYLRVIYDNATESDLFLRSLQRALYKDDTGRRIFVFLMTLWPMNDFQSRATSGQAKLLFFSYTYFCDITGKGFYAIVEVGIATQWGSP
jgi:hypothetical protein